MKPCCQKYPNAYVNIREYDRNIVEQTERIHEQIEQTKENADQQIERIREQIAQNEQATEEQIERVREQTKEFRDNSVERVERIRERMEELRVEAENHSERVHVETRTSAEQPDKVQSLIERFDTQYNERHANATISQTHVMNGVEVLKYSGKLLPLTEMDERYPRSEWIQTLLDKNITIDNLHAYCRYLNARDMLMRIEKKPNVWTSGLFDIPSH